MVHNWKAYELSQLIAERLLKANLIAEKDLLMVRGIIQIEMEEAEG